MQSLIAHPVLGQIGERAAHYPVEPLDAPGESGLPLPIVRPFASRHIYEVRNS